MPEILHVPIQSPAVMALVIHAFQSQQATGRNAAAFQQIFRTLLDAPIPGDGPDVLTLGRAFQEAQLERGSRGEALVYQDGI